MTELISTGEMTLVVTIALALCAGIGWLVKGDDE